ncbi:hypothetical protein BTVI_02786 [Pitangus sulphuratus]|nr:hypothetical protein BTVI_02786 [Pitangus sulphuratus]
MLLRFTSWFLQALTKSQQWVECVTELFCAKCFHLDIMPASGEADFLFQNDLPLSGFVSGMFWAWKGKGRGALIALAGDHCWDCNRCRGCVFALLEEENMPEVLKWILEDCHSPSRSSEASNPKSTLEIMT